MILGQSALERFGWHADEAVRLNEEMYLRPRHTPTAEQAEGMKEMLDLAKVVQATAQEDDLKVSSLTKEEREKLQRSELDKQGMAADEELIYGESESEIEGDDEMPEAA